MKRNLHRNMDLPDREIWHLLLEQWKSDGVEPPPVVIRHAEKEIGLALTPAIHA